MANELTPGAKCFPAATYWRRRFAPISYSLVCNDNTAVTSLSYDPIKIQQKSKQKIYPKLTKGKNTESSYLGVFHCDFGEEKKNLAESLDLIWIYLSHATWTLSVYLPPPPAAPQLTSPNSMHNRWAKAADLEAEPIRRVWNLHCPDTSKDSR